MGMFDTELGEPFSDHFREGQVFTLTHIALGPEIHTAYGEGRPALLTIDGKVYSAFGQTLQQQATALTDGDLPARVAMVRRSTRGGQSYKVIVRESEVPTAGPAHAILAQDDIPF